MTDPLDRFIAAWLVLLAIVALVQAARSARWREHLGGWLLAFIALLSD